MRESKMLRRAGLALGALAAAGLLAAYAVPLPARLAVPASTVVRFADGSPAHVFLSPDEKYRMAVRLEDVDPDYLAALLRFEDKRFYSHPGVDPIAVARAAFLNLRFGRVVSGGSTITMQLVRLLEPRPRTLRSKGIEAFRALQLELHLTKDEILEAYLRHTPYGGNLEGIAAACYAYFGHGPRDLAPDEIATLLAVPQKPSERAPSTARAARLENARNEIAAWLLERGALGREGAAAQEILREIASAPVVTRIQSMPRHAPHAAYWLRGGAPGLAASSLETTLDPGIQRLAERLLAGARDEMARKGISHGALVVVEHRTGEVRALVGGFDFHAEEDGAQIPAFAVPRSPGSALKPFIYALALERGLALPEHLVPDVPVSYGGYAPDNYDGRFTGLVRLEDALSLSLNVPFVRLLNEVGLERLLGTMRLAGVESLVETPGYYGLSAAIGGIELTPLELAGLYAGLANEGRFAPLRWIRQENVPGARLLSPGAAYLTRRALARRDRPDFPERRRVSGAPARIHWKTGTSYGHRDAWAAGSDARYTAVVWLGNLDHRPSVDLVGAEAAGPLLFDLLEAVAERSRLSFPDTAPPDLKSIAVCRYSGHLPTRACEATERAVALADRVPTKLCPYHRSVDVDVASGLALDPSCRAGRRFETRTFLVWPASIRRFLETGARRFPSTPPLAPGCLVAEERNPPVILSPARNQILFLLPGVPEHEQEVPLEAESTAPGAELSWFIDGAFLAKAPAEQIVWWTPTPGRHEILVMDPSGASARVLLDVRRPGRPSAQARSIE